MSDETSNSQPAGAEPARSADGKSTEDFQSPPAKRSSPLLDDQPTVITGRSPHPASKPGTTDAFVQVGPNKLDPGSRLGHYELQKYIGGGGMGRVYRGVDKALGRTVAVKVLSREQAGDRDTVLRFLNEARSAARLNHENIAQVFFVGEDRGLPYIAFEFVDGINIRVLVEQKGPLPLAQAVSYTLQVAEALAHAADHHVVHRDVKPSNVLITPEGRAKLIDMGLARLRTPDESGGDLTASGVTLGTFDYISPEQARDPRNADARSDIYSLGCTFFFTLAGRPPFPEGTVLQKLLQHQGDEPPDIQRFRPELPEDVSQVLQKMMTKDPNRRYEDFPKLIEALLSLAELAGLRPMGPGKTMWVAPKQTKMSWLQRHAPWLAPIAALICIMVSLHVFFWSSPTEQGDSLPPMSVDRLDGRSSPVSPSGSRPLPGGAGTRSDRSAEESPGASSTETGPGRLPEPVGLANGKEASAEAAAGLPVDGATGRAGTSGSQQAVDVARLNPLSAFIANLSKREGLRQDPIKGEVAWVGRTALGLSLASRGGPAGAGLYAASATPSDAGSTADPADQQPPDRNKDVLIVSADAQGDNEFSTLAAALDAAKSGEVIELRYDGRGEEKPLTLANLDITIRAGEGFHPVVAFRPSEMDPIKYRRSMFALAGGNMTLTDVALELDIPREVPADSWSLLEIGRGGKVTLEKCSLTIRNASDQLAAYQQEVSFFHLKPVEETDATVVDTPDADPPSVRIELEDCIVRGEAVFLRAEELRPVDLVWKNGLLITTERLVVADGGAKPPLAGETLRIDLEHLTAIARRGFFLFTHSEFTPHQLATDVQCAASILMVSEGPLIEQVGVVDVARTVERITWKGGPNFFEGLSKFWSIRPANPLTPRKQIALDAWISHWGIDAENPPPVDQVKWLRLPEADRPVHTHTPADYALDRSAISNPAIGVAENDQDAGFLADRLPGLPPEPAAEKADTGKTEN